MRDCDLKLIKMKKIVLLIMVMVSFTWFAEAQKQSKTSKVKFEVDGVCKMCKDRIEKTVMLTKGVKFVSWNVDTKELYCIFNNKKTSALKIKQALANAGHDTKEIKATQEAYDSLDACCRYRELEKH